MFLLMLVRPSLVSVMSKEVPPMSTVMTFFFLNGAATIEAGLRRRGRAGIDRIDRAVGHRLADRQAAVGLEIAHRLLRRRASRK